MTTPPVGPFIILRIIKGQWFKRLIMPTQLIMWLQNNKTYLPRFTKVYYPTNDCSVSQATSKKGRQNKLLYARGDAKVSHYKLHKLTASKGSHFWHVVKPGLDWTGLDWTGLDWTGLDWTGLDWTGLDWTGLVKPRFVKPGLVKPGLVISRLRMLRLTLPANSSPIKHSHIKPIPFLKQ